MFKKILVALKSLKDKGVYHRDVKPANILVDKNFDRVWLADLGEFKINENK